MILKIDYNDTVKLQKITKTSFLLRHKDSVTEKTSSKWRHKTFHFQAPLSAKSWLRSWANSQILTIG